MSGTNLFSHSHINKKKKKKVKYTIDLEIVSISSSLNFRLKRPCERISDHRPQLIKKNKINKNNKIQHQIHFQRGKKKKKFFFRGFRLSCTVYNTQH